MTLRHTVPALLLIALAPVLAAAQTSTPVARAFEHYEAIRVVLAQDKMDNIRTHATALAPLAGQLVGKNAQASAERVAMAKTINDVRDEFAVLSVALVPKFLLAKLPGVRGFMCPMKKDAYWVQRGTALENPYYGKAMLACGGEILVAAR